MKATFKHTYKKAGLDGNVRDINVYLVSGTKAELEAYKTAQGEHFVEDDKGIPLYFSTKVLPRTITLNISQKTNKVYADTSEWDTIKNLSNQFSGALGMALAQLGAQQIMAQMNISSPVQAQPVTEPEANKSIEE